MCEVLRQKNSEKSVYLRCPLGFQRDVYEPEEAVLLRSESEHNGPSEAGIGLHCIRTQDLLLQLWNQR